MSNKPPGGGLDNIRNLKWACERYAAALKDGTAADITTCLRVMENTLNNILLLSHSSGNPFQIVGCSLDSGGVVSITTSHSHLVRVSKEIVTIQ